MTRHTLSTERMAEDDGGECVAATVAITFRYSAPGPSGGTWNSPVGSWDPPDDEEIDFRSAAVLIDHRWIGIPWAAPLSQWCAEWLDQHHDEAREMAGDDAVAAAEARLEMRRDEQMWRDEK